MTTITVSINRPWQEVYDAIWQPEAFGKWASGLSKASLQKDGDQWKAEGPDGPIRVRFTDHNPFGIMDHYVDLGAGPEIYVPMRVIASAGGAAVMLTLSRQPNMSDAKFAADQAWGVERDLMALRDLITVDA